MADLFRYDRCQMTSNWPELHTCPELIEFIQRVGFLPLLDSGVPGYAAESLMAEECRYVEFADGSWEWPLWQWKGSVVREGGCVYGKIFGGKAGFVSREWWPDLASWRRSRSPEPEADSIDGIILATLRAEGSMVTRQLRTACGFTGAGMRSRFDAHITRLQMACRIVTEDFVYPRDRHGREYGFGWALLTTPEHLMGRGVTACPRSPEESRLRIEAHLRRLLPAVTDRQLSKLVG